MKIATIRIAVSALFLAIVTGCASVHPDAQGGTKDAQPIDPAFDRRFKAQRIVTKGTHLGWVAARSVFENPINRPFSHASSLASYAVQSSGGLLRRVAMATIQMPALDDDIPKLSYAEPMDLDVFEKILDKTTGTQRDRGHIKFLVDGEEYFGRLAEVIDSAKESIDIRTYIFDNDDYAITVADQLRRRSKDVRVRVMMDGLGNMMALHADSDTMPADHRVPLSIYSYLKRDSKVKVRNNTNPWATGDHTKTSIIDNRTAFVGGMNIGREYRYDWHDLMMEVTGPVVDKLQFESDKAWARAGILGDLSNLFAFLKGKNKHAQESGYPIRVLQTRNFDSDIHRAQIAAIQNAQSYILIENPYFSDDRTIYELAKARRRGVEIRVIIPTAGNHGAMNASNKVTINTLLKNGIRVYGFPGMSHVKAAIFDGWASVGSANLDKLSLKVNKELNLATSDPKTVQALMDRVFIPDLMMSREITEPVPVTAGSGLAEIIVDELL